jgi:hypothetical protein
LQNKYRIYENCYLACIDNYENSNCNKLFIPNKNTKLKPINNHDVINNMKEYVNNKSCGLSSTIGNIDHNFYIKRLMNRINNVEKYSTINKSLFISTSLNSSSKNHNIRYSNNKLLPSIQQQLNGLKTNKDEDNYNYQEISDLLGAGVIFLYTFISIFYEKSLIQKCLFFSRIKNRKKTDFKNKTKKIFFIKRRVFANAEAKEKLFKYLNRLISTISENYLNQLNNFFSKIKLIKSLQIKIKCYLYYIRSKTKLKKRLSLRNKLKIIFKAFFQKSKLRLKKIVIIQSKFRQK